MSDEVEINITPEKLPALYEHAMNVYNAMFKHAGKRSDGKVVYTGFLSRLIKDEVLLSTPMYSHTTKVLQEMGCIEQIKRGGGGTPSIWHLVRMPSEDQFLIVRNGTKTSTGQIFGPGPGKYEALVARVAEMDQKISSFDDYMRKTADALMQQGTALQRLEQRMFDLTKRVESGNTVTPRVEEVLDINI